MFPLLLYLFTRFKAQATRYKEQTKGPQFDSAGRDLEMLEAQKVAEETLTKKLNKDLKDCIDQAINNRSVQNQQFYFMHMNSMCKVYNEVFQKMPFTYNLPIFAKFKLSRFSSVVGDGTR